MKNAWLESSARIGPSVGPVQAKMAEMLVWVHDLDQYEHPYHLKPGK